MKIFLDTANIQLLERWISTGLIDGVTTNPTHLSKEGVDPTQQVRSICALFPDGAISVEIVASDPDQAYEQAKKIASLSPNIVVKIPCHIDYYATIKKLVAESIPLNITLVFSLSQGLMMAKLGVAYISPFVGRLDDAGGNGLQLLSDLRSMIDTYQFSTKILAASIRNVDHVEGAIKAGADVVTVPEFILQQIVSNSLTDNGIIQFLQDWDRLKVIQFPS